MNKKTLSMILVVILLMTACVAGTLAWLTDQTQEVQNTFTVGNIDITLSESDSDGDGDVNKNSYKMVPGARISKDPTATVLKGSEKCWLFVEITETEDFDEYLTYTLADGWKQVATENNSVVYGYEEIIDASADDVVKSVLLNNQITVNTTVTKADMEELEKDGAVLPALTFKAYAIQSDNLGENGDTAAKAWDMLKAQG